MTDFRDELLRLILDKVTIQNGELTIINEENILKTQRLGILLITDLFEGKNDEGENYREKFDAIRYSWRADSLNPLLFEPFETAITELKLENKATFHDFKKKVDRDLIKIEQQEQLVDFNFFYPIRIQHENKIKKMEIEGISVEIKTFQEVENFLSNPDLLNEIREYNMNYSTQLNLSSFCYIHISLSARNLCMLKKAARNAQLIVSIIAYIENYGVMWRTLIGPPRSISDLDVEIELAFFSEKIFESLFKISNL